MDETQGPHRGHDALRPAPTREPAQPAVADAAELRRPGLDDLGRLDRTFGRDEITVVRHEVQSRLITFGFTGDRLQGFVLAVNEVITNVVLHAGGHGRLVLWMTGGSAWCTVTDSGPGIPQRFLSQPEAPEAFEVGGRGIWLAYALCDEVTVATGPIGTTVGLKMALPGADKPSDLVNGASTAV